MATNPRISVVTIVRNDRDALATTIASVIGQTYPAIEYIVVDGASTDGSVDLICQHAPSISRWISEPDHGIYDAINKGARLATGEWVIFMNAGDAFAEASTVAEVFEAGIGEDIGFVYGDKIVQYAGYEVLRASGPIDLLWQGSQFSHQAVFIRNAYQRAHPYNTANRISADFELFYGAYRAGKRFLQLHKPIARVAAGGLSDRARIENIASFYRVVRRDRTEARIHRHFCALIALNLLKNGIKTLLPERWVHGWRRRNADIP